MLNADDQLIQKSEVLDQIESGGNLRLSVMQKSDAHLGALLAAKLPFLQTAKPSGWQPTARSLLPKA